VGALRRWQRLFVRRASWFLFRILSRQDRIVVFLGLFTGWDLFDFHFII
jgi:hypothetical protein